MRGIVKVAAVSSLVLVIVKAMLQRYCDLNSSTVISEEIGIET